jgi:hypothetical protein
MFDRVDSERVPAPRLARDSQNINSDNQSFDRRGTHRGTDSTRIMIGLVLSEAVPHFSGWWAPTTGSGGGLS